MMKTCSKCGKEKDRDRDFYKGPKYRDGYQSYCKQCRADMPSRTPAAKLAQMQNLRDRNRRFLRDYYLQHPCVDCGESDPVVLEPDHCRGSKLSNVSKLVHNTRSLAVIQTELDKCEIVCSNCHRKRTAIQQGWFVG